MKQIGRITIAISLTLLPCAGCFRARPVDLRGDGFQPDSTLDQHYRAADSSTGRQGFSTKAQEIEGSLGVR